VTVRQQSGESGRLEFFPQEGWKGALVYWSKTPSQNRVGTFAVDQVAALRQELENAQ